MFLNNICFLIYYLYLGEILVIRLPIELPLLKVSIQSKSVKSFYKERKEPFRNNSMLNI